MGLVFIIRCLAVVIVGLEFCFAGEEGEKKKRILPVFEIVQFNNDACNGTGTTQGTCYTAEECTSLEGTASGTCAQGYGVCCVFMKTCGQTTNQNCTFFTATTITDNSACKLEVCPCSKHICQIRLDFQTFTISQPLNTDVVSTFVMNGAMKNMATAISGAVPATQDTRCLTDSFSVTSPGNTAPPVICGTNTGQHMYLEASDCCNTLAFNFGQMMAGAPTANRAFNIKITQYSCDYNNLAPAGCTKYFFGPNSQSVMTYNFGGGSQLADQREKICVRRESNTCQICWSPRVGDTFDVSGTSKNPPIAGLKDLCCGYGTSKQTNTLGFDCIIIPGASSVMKARLMADEFCGGVKTAVAMGAAKTGFFGGTGAPTVNNVKSVCSRKLPFVLSYYTDSYEVFAEGKKVGAAAVYNNVGFKITYMLNNCP